MQVLFKIPLNTSWPSLSLTHSPGVWLLFLSFRGLQLLCFLLFSGLLPPRLLRHSVLRRIRVKALWGHQWRQKNHLLRPPGFIFSPTIDGYSSSTCGPLRTHQSIQDEFKTCRTPFKRKSFLDQRLKCRSGIVYNTFFWSDLLFSLDIKRTQKESLLKWLSLLNGSHIYVSCKDFAPQHKQIDTHGTGDLSVILLLRFLSKIEVKIRIGINPKSAYSRQLLIYDKSTYLHD